MTHCLKSFLVQTALAVLTTFSLAVSAQTDNSAFIPKVEKVTDKVYAIVGEIGPRSPANQGLNNTVGFMLTDDGVVLAGSGATAGSAKMLETAIKTVTNKPIKRVINIGVQDHHWMGNSYFLANNIPVSALSKTIASQREQEAMNRMRLANGIGSTPEELQVEFASESFDADEKRLTIGGMEMVLRYLGDAHFPGDAILWLPEESVVFTGDIVFNDRILGVLPEISKVRNWQVTFNKVTELNPAHVIPGHGHASDWPTAQKNTGDYLDWLLTEVGQAIDDLEELGDTVENLKAVDRFQFLQLHDSLHGRNIHQTYLQLEAE